MAQGINKKSKEKEQKSKTPLSGVLKATRYASAIFT
jgi:hypothetical protein